MGQDKDARLLMRPAADEVMGSMWHIRPIDTAMKLVGLEPKSADDLDCIAQSIYERAVSDNQSAMESYADLIHLLKTRFPDFGQKADAKPGTFIEKMLNKIGEEYQDLCEDLDEELPDGERHDSSRVDQSLALTLLIGHLHNRKATNLITSYLVQEHIDTRDHLPGELFLRRTCTLLRVIGKSIDKSESGKSIMTGYFARLNTLGATKSDDGKDELVYSDEIRAEIKALQDARFNGWPLMTACIVLQLVRGLAFTHNTSLDPTTTVEGDSISVQTMAGQQCAVLKNMRLDTLNFDEARDNVAKQLGVLPERLTLTPADASEATSRVQSPQKKRGFRKIMRRLFRPVPLAGYSGGCENGVSHSQPQSLQSIIRKGSAESSDGDEYEGPKSFPF